MKIDRREFLKLTPLLLGLTVDIDPSNISSILKEVTTDSLSKGLFSQSKQPNEASTSLVMPHPETGSLALSQQQVQQLHRFAKASIRYFTSHEANNSEVGFTHAFFGTGRFRDYDENGNFLGDKNMERGYGSHVNINEVTLRFLSLSVAYKMGWLDYLNVDKQYTESWGQILKGLRTLDAMQTAGNSDQFDKGQFHRSYLTTKQPDDVDRKVNEIVRASNENIQSSDDNALPFMNLLILEGLAKESNIDIPDAAEIIQLCQAIRGRIDLKAFVVDNKLVHNIENNQPSNQIWDRIAAEGPIILAALLLSGQITEEEFYLIAPSLENHPVHWKTPTDEIIYVDKPSFHAAMFIHGLRAIHGLPVTKEEHLLLNFFETSTKPTFEAHINYAEYYGFKAFGSQVMTQALYGTPLFEMNNKQVQFPGNEDNLMPVPGTSLSRATASHAWFIPLARWRYLTKQNIDTIFNWMNEFEADFFHSGSDTALGWEAAIPWTPDDKTYAWKASDGTWRYTDWGRPYEALNTAYTILSIFDALNQDTPLASYNIEAKRLKSIAEYFDTGAQLRLNCINLPIIVKNEM